MTERRNSSEVIDLVSDGEEAEVAVGNANFPKVKQEVEEQPINRPNLPNLSTVLPKQEPDEITNLPTSGSTSKVYSKQFWKAGDYDVQKTSRKLTQEGMNHIRVHPKFLHSNATSHKWALGAIAELLDNSVDEIQNGATFVNVDKIDNPRDNSPALLVQDNGGGMDPLCMRRCMSLGYSDKTTSSTIGQYGNGFKTSTMRLGADVVVFSRCSRSRVSTQSVGLLSYTFLRETGKMDIVVPMVDYELTDSGEAKRLIRSSKEDWLENLSTLLQWSPYSTESDLLKEFDDIGVHGTKVIIYNLWLNDEGQMELDFDSDTQDIKLRSAPKSELPDGRSKKLFDGHISNRLKYSLRAYASILYLQLPKTFDIILRGQLVDTYDVGLDLMYPEYILYKPQVGINKEVSVVTTIGFIKEARQINVHGFCVYHKNRLIMPFWKVFHENSSRGRGVVGVLEADFIEPAHDKQDFERTAVFQRLETRLKQMTGEYWNLHCHLIGYQYNSNKPSKPRNNSNVAAANSSASLALLSNQPGDSREERSYSRANETLVQLPSNNLTAITPDNEIASPGLPSMHTRSTPVQLQTSNSQALMVDVKPVLLSHSTVQQTQHTSLQSRSPVQQSQEQVNASIYRSQTRADMSTPPSCHSRNEDASNCTPESCLDNTISDSSVLNANNDTSRAREPSNIGNRTVESTNGHTVRTENLVSDIPSPMNNGSSANIISRPKRKISDMQHTEETRKTSRTSSASPNGSHINNASANDTGTDSMRKKIVELQEENRRLKEQDLQLSVKEQELESKIDKLESEIMEFHSKYNAVLLDARLMGFIKEEVC